MRYRIRYGIIIRSRYFFLIAVLIRIVAFPSSSNACSTQSCLDHGFEVKQDFVLRVKHWGRPLARVAVRITSFIDGKKVEHFFASTGIDGTVHVTGLQAGDYWMETDLLGISAGGGCFHVA